MYLLILFSFPLSQIFNRFELHVSPIYRYRQSKNRFEYFTFPHSIFSATMDPKYRRMLLCAPPPQIPSNIAASRNLNSDVDQQQLFFSVGHERGRAGIEGFGIISCGFETFRGG
jgi:hypothetical protein